MEFSIRHYNENISEYELSECFILLRMRRGQMGNACYFTPILTQITFVTTSTIMGLTHTYTHTRLVLAQDKFLHARIVTLYTQGLGSGRMVMPRLLIIFRL